MGKSLITSIFLAFQAFFFMVYGSKTWDRGLSIKLIHRDSSESPLFKPNLTETQRTENLILQSKSRLAHLARNRDHISHNRNPNATKIFDTEALSSVVEGLVNSVYLGQVGIGTFGSSTIPYLLHMDTGSSLTWTQCEGCRSPGHQCFHQNEPIFRDSRSRSYHKIPCARHPLCFPGRCSGGFCIYRLRYDDGASTEGFLATETFSFGAPSRWETVPRILFGCGFDQRNMNYGTTGKVAGIMGLAWGRQSLVGQLGHRVQHRFSYCLNPVSSGAHSYLRFGSDVPSSPTRLRTTNLVQLHSFMPYFVNLMDISVANRRLRIPAPFLSRRPHQDSMSGVIIDSGSNYSFLVEPAYAILEEAMTRHLMSTIPGLTRIHLPNYFKLCFTRPEESFAGLPSLTFHFGGWADMVVPPEGTFYLSGTRRNMFCMAVLPSDYNPSKGGVSMIGAYQQTNQRLVFDVALKRLHFGPENCATNG